MVGWRDFVEGHHHWFRPFFYHGALRPFGHPPPTTHPPPTPPFRPWPRPLPWAHLPPTHSPTTQPRFSPVRPSCTEFLPGFSSAFFLWFVERKEVRLTKGSTWSNTGRQVSTDRFRGWVRGAGSRAKGEGKGWAKGENRGAGNGDGCVGFATISWWAGFRIRFFLSFFFLGFLRSGSVSIFGFWFVDDVHFILGALFGIRSTIDRWFYTFYWVLLGFPRLPWVSTGFSGFYWVLPSFTGFYWVLPW